MIDFNVEPAPKSNEELLFDQLNEEYSGKFGRPYVFAVGVDSKTWSEVIADIRRCIDTGEPQAQPEYSSGNVY